MASEYAMVAIAIFGAAFLWYSNELRKENSLLWAQAFQTLSFLFMLVDFTIMSQFFLTEGLYDMQDLVMGGLWYTVFIFMWAIVLFWIVSLILAFITTLRKPKLEKVEQVGGNRFGP